MKEKSFGKYTFDIVNISLLTIFALITIIPFIHIISSSFASVEEYNSRSFLLIPTDFSLSAYRYIFSTNALPASLWITIKITVIGTLFSLLMTTLLGYPLSRRRFHFKRTIMFLIVFTMIFSGGMIPDYLIVKELGLLNNFASLIIPRAIIAFYLIILINFFRGIPEEIEESAKIDGCGDLTLLFRIMLPLALPAIATLTLFYAVFQWNTYLHAILYINDTEKWPIQVLLRQIVMVSQAGFVEQGSVDGESSIPPETVKMAVITVATLPILCVYPFLQKYFAKGALIGSVKG
ncbi:carbohydrate ABC transporter permease [Paenibacillus nasutitermitis]|uniref:ABC transporter permease protein YtcP n=1 Tax=Paenibacillus nasutitermitis TaxID=1652958 RepID=A0A917DMQ3_9BACL|nr:carbohydrate ABC transporter permease [Paenibacillus nasutitermitis]GGD52218.1 putative ABC transporter permease protein YtcP [Paenibacillus nasutitermitis]